MTPIAPAATNALDILINAKALLLTDGWIQGKFRCDTGAYCADGALRVAAGGTSILGTERVNEPEAGTPEYEAYCTAVFAVTDQIEPGWREALVEEWRELYDEGGDPAQSDLLDHAQNTIHNYNDRQVHTQTGRDRVISQFDGAIAVTPA